MIELSFSIYELELYLLVLVRVTCFFFTAPFFSMNNTPARIKIALGVFTSYLIYQSIYPHEQLVYETVFEYAVIIMKEALTGLMIGLAAGVCNSIIIFAGRMIDMEIGLAMANVFDPTTKEMSSITGILYEYLVLMVLVVTDMQHYLIRALVDTFTLIPLNGAVFRGEMIVDSVVMFLGDYINIGFRICLPVFCAMLITNCILGIMAKVAPQMNMFAVGIQIKLLVGLMVIFLTVGMLPYIADFIFSEMKTMIVAFVEALMP